MSDITHTGLIPEISDDELRYLATHIKPVVFNERGRPQFIEPIDVKDDILNPEKVRILGDTPTIKPQRHYDVYIKTLRKDNKMFCPRISDIFAQVPLQLRNVRTSNISAFSVSAINFCGTEEYCGNTLIIEGLGPETKEFRGIQYMKGNVVLYSCDLPEQIKAQPVLGL